MSGSVNSAAEFARCRTSGVEAKAQRQEAFDRRLWASKGIAHAIYEADGKRRRLVLDDHKFLGCEAIILEAEKRIAARAASAAKPAASAADGAA